MAQEYLIKKLVRTSPKNRNKQQVFFILPQDWSHFDFIQLERTEDGDLLLSPVLNEDIIKQFPKDFRGKKVFRVGDQVRVEKWYGPTKIGNTTDYESIGDWEDKNIDGDW
jgi:hypothetical protein